MPVNTDIQQQVFDLLSRASTLSFVNADGETTSQTGLHPGQRVTAEVLSLLPNQRTQVSVGSDKFNLKLPMAVQVGQSLELTFVSDSPRTTFAIARPGGSAPPVTLSDASRLLGLLVGNEQLDNPQIRSSLVGIGDLLRRSSGEAGVLANLMDEALTYGGGRAASSSLRLPVEVVSAPRGEVPQNAASGAAVTPEQTRLTAFESNASQMLQHIARTSRFLLTEAVNSPMSPLPLMPGDEVDAAVLGTLPGGRAFVQVAGATLELQLSRAVSEGEILRLTYIASQPKPLFALSRGALGMETGALSEAGRWLSGLEHSAGGASGQQMYVLERLNTILKNLPPDSPAFTAIMDEAITYQSFAQRGQTAGEQLSAQVGAALLASQSAMQSGSGIILSDDMAKLLQALIKGNRLALLETLNQQASPPGLAPGQQLKGEVMSLLGDGRTLVQVAGQMFEFSMPKGTLRGDMLTLFFITADPRPTFLATRFGRPGDSKVSDTGRWLSSFLGTAVDQAGPQRAYGLLQTLLEGPPNDARHVSSMLHQGLRESGLFYESHLARWFGGEYQLADILREPQGRLSELKQHTLAQAAHNLPAEGHVSSPLKPGSLEIMEAAFKKAGAGAGSEAVADQRALPTVREQLNTLQSGQILFRGELFSGQPLEWSVKEREARRTPDGGQERNWDTTIQLDLPRLGSIAARMTLEGGKITIDLQTEDADGAEILTQARPELADQLQAAGLVPGNIGVRYEKS